MVLEGEMEPLSLDSKSVTEKDLHALCMDHMPQPLIHNISNTLPQTMAGGAAPPTIEQGKQPAMLLLRQIRDDFHHLLQSCLSISQGL
jgi:hypothetical protein